PSSPDAADALVEAVAGAGRDFATLLRVRGRVRVTWVLLPEALSLAEARDGVDALDGSGIGVDDVLGNRVTPPPPGPCALCDGRRTVETDVLRAVRTELGGRARGMPRRPLRVAPALEREPRGVVALRALAARLAALDVFDAPRRT